MLIYIQWIRTIAKLNAARKKPVAKSTSKAVNIALPVSALTVTKWASASPWITRIALRTRTVDVCAKIASVKPVGTLVIAIVTLAIAVIQEKRKNAVTK